MDDSEFAHQLDRTLYTYNEKSKSILRSRSYTLATNIRITIREPKLFAKKVIRLLVRNPHKLKQIILGQRMIQNFDADRELLNKEYYRWIKEVETADMDGGVQRKQAQSLKHKPLVSLITPVFDPPVGAHDKLIRSVMEQTYGNFELLLFNFGKDRAVRDLLDSWAVKDKRVVVKHDLPNEGISKNSNLCLKYVTGEYVGLLDHDDALMPDALFECVKAANEHDADFIYTDKDKITEDDRRHEPLFKPDWSPEMALGGNYLTHFDLMRTRLVRDVGGWDAHTDGAQDWDLFLRLLDVTDKVVHVPKIVYHWRTVAGSTSVQISVKPYALAAQRLAVQKHLERKKLKASAFQDDTGQMYIEWPTKNDPRSFVIHMRYGDVKQTLELIEGIKQAADFNQASKIFVLAEKGLLDEKSQEELKATDSTTFVKYESGAFAKRVTRCLKDAEHKTAIYLTDSNKKISTLLPGNSWISQLCGWLNIEGVYAAGAASYAEDGKVVDIGSFFNPAVAKFEKYYFSTGFRSGYNGYIQWLRNFVMVSERLFALDTSLLASSSWDELVEDMRDDEFCQCLALVSHAAGGRGVYDPAVSAIDTAPFYYLLPNSMVTRKYIDHKCPDLLKADPYYNLNLNDYYQDPRPMPAIEKPSYPKGFRIFSTDQAS